MDQEEYALLGTGVLVVVRTFRLNAICLSGAERHGFIRPLQGDPQRTGEDIVVVVRGRVEVPRDRIPRSQGESPNAEFIRTEDLVDGPDRIGP